MNTPEGSVPRGVAIIGVGNTLRRDDGIGPALVVRLRSMPEIASVADCIDVGCRAFDIIDIVAGRWRVIVLDAADFGGQPGDVRVSDASRWSPDQIRGAVSLHRDDLAQAIMLAREIYNDVPVTVVAVQPADIGPGERLTSRLERRVPEIIESISQTVLASAAASGG